MSFGRSTLPTSTTNTSASSVADPELVDSDSALRQANKKFKHSPDASIPIYTTESVDTSVAVATLPPQTDFQQASSAIAAARSPSALLDDFDSATPTDLYQHHSATEQLQQQQAFSSTPLASPIASASADLDLNGRVEHLLQEQTQQQQSQQQHQPQSDVTMSSHSSRNSSRGHSPVNGGGEEGAAIGNSTGDAPLQAGGTSAQPQAKANNTAKSTDPAGQSIAEAELEGRFKVIRYLGKGSYGTVFVAEELSTGKQVAIKKIPKVFDNQTNAKRLLREIKILRMLGHHNVIGYRGLLAPSIPATFNSLLIVFEFVDTDLAKLLASDQPITNQHVQYFLYQLLCGIHYIHSAQVIHRDIKPANVLINADCSLKICDFGLSRSTLGPNPSAAAKKLAEDSMVEQAKKQADLLAQAGAPKREARQVSQDKVTNLAQPQKLARELTKHVVTRWYRAPEVILLSDRYTTAIDMWSIGCIFSELLSMQTRTSRRALFPGRTCFPFSADNNPLAYTDQLDQLNVIFDVIGTPTKEEIEKIDNDRARSYLRSLPFKPKIDLPRRFAGADAQAVDLLQKLLFFDPSKRYTARQALEHPYLAEFRQPEDEGVYQQPTSHLPDFAFEDKPITKDEIKSLIVNEILIDNPQCKIIDFFPSGTNVGSAAASTQAAAAIQKEAEQKRKAEQQQQQQQQQGK